MKRFLLKISVFILLIIGLQVVMARPVDIPNEIKLLDFFMKHHADIVYFGDSTINWAAASDANQESMPGLLQKLMPQVLVAKITHASYQSDVYAAYAKYIRRKNYHPQFVIIPINLRSFSVEWDRQPLWQFDQEKLILAMKDTFWMKFSKPLAVFKFFDPRITRFAYEQSKVYDEGVLIGRARDFDNSQYQKMTPEHFANKLRFRYMSTISTGHRKLKSLVLTADLLRQQGIEPVFYVTPVDWETIAKTLGIRSQERMEANVLTLKTALAQRGVELLDFSQTLPTSEFSWPEDGEGPHYPNEHLRLRGRMFVAKSLADRIELIKISKDKNGSIF